MHVYNCLVSGTFHPPSGALFRFPSPYWCAIGLDEYLALEAAGFLLPIAYPSYGTQAKEPSSSSPPPTGLSPSMADHSRSLRVEPDRRERSCLNTTLQACRPRLFRFGLVPFHSPLLRESRLISIPPPTQMLPFGGFPHPPCGECSPSRSLRKVTHSATPGSTDACSYPRRIAACHGLHQLSSRSIHQAASLCHGPNFPLEQSVTCL